MTRQRLADALLALALTALVQWQIWHPDRADPDNAFELPAVTSPILAVATLSVAWRRRFPLAATLAFAAAIGLQAVVTADFAASPGLFFAGIAVLYAVAAHAERREAVLGLLAVAVAMTARDVHGLPYSELDVWNGAFFYLVLLLAFAAGLFVGARRRAAALEARAARLERERLSRDEAVAEERSRIARELHDIVAHSVSAAVVQAEAAAEVLDREPERARASLDRIQGSSREALGEMRRLVGHMRGVEASLPPPRGFDDLGRLVADAREDGMTVELTVEGDVAGVPPGIEGSVFRIVQEALTNARRHAGRPARVDVVLRRRAGMLEVEIADDGSEPGDADGGGFGLIGMRERAAYFGGTFEAAPGSGGGFVVRACFPLAPVPGGTP